MGVNEDAERARRDREALERKRHEQKVAQQRAGEVEQARRNELLHQYLEYVRRYNIPHTSRDGWFFQKRIWTLYSGSGDQGGGKSAGQVAARVCSDGTVDSWNMCSADIFKAIVAKVAQYGHPWPYDD